MSAHACACIREFVSRDEGRGGGGIHGWMCELDVGVRARTYKHSTTEA